MRKYSKDSKIKDWHVLLVGVGILSFGVILGGMGLVESYRHHRIMDKGVSTVGEVVSVDFNRGYRNTKADQTISFTVDNREYSTSIRETYNSISDGSRSEFTEKVIGTEYTIFYDPDNPDAAVVEGRDLGYAWPLLFLLFFGVIGGFITYAMAQDMIKRRLKATE